MQKSRKSVTSWYFIGFLCNICFLFDPEADLCLFTPYSVYNCAVYMIVLMTGKLQKTHNDQITPRKGLVLLLVKSKHRKVMTT